MIDDGCGMDETTRAQVFEPFFTTKEQGTGLGLSMAYGTAKNHGGGISITSVEGGGTTLSVWIPAAEHETESPEARTEPSTPKACGHVLFVDDDAGVREAGQTVRYPPSRGAPKRSERAPPSARRDATESRALVIKYIGSKRTLLPVVLEAVAAVPGARTVVDLFSGTSRVGHALKGAGYRVLANDHNTYAATLARCYVGADREDIERDATRLLAELDALPGRPGWFTHTFCEQSRFFQPKNGARVDAIREAIARKSLEPELEAVLLVALMEAADRVDSTCGLQMAYLKQWAARAHNDLSLRMPDVLPRAQAGKSEVHQLEAVEAARSLKADVAYLDPPYNQHSYLSNYHVWESLVLWDKPEVYGVACKRVDCRTRKSPFNSKRKFGDALTELVEAVEAKVLLVSFNNEGYIAREDMEALLSTRGRVTVLSHDYKRYVGAQIGIYNPSGEKVGAVSHLRNLEYLYVVETDALDGALALPGAEPEPESAQLALFDA